MLSKLLATLQAGGDNLVDSIFEALQLQSRHTITDELRRFIKVANHEVVKTGELQTNSVAIKVVRPKPN